LIDDVLPAAEGGVHDCSGVADAHVLRVHAELSVETHVAIRCHRGGQRHFIFT
jgi:hypothetical protein